MKIINTKSLPDSVRNLTAAGIDPADAAALRRIAMTLHAWHEAECGTEAGGIERDEETGKTYWYHADTGRRTPCQDRETGALRRLAEIMARYPALGYYVQSDPRGPALYVLRPGDVLEGADPASCYRNGLAVYK